MDYYCQVEYLVIIFENKKNNEEPYPYRVLFNQYTMGRFPRHIIKMYVIDNLDIRQSEKVNKYFLKEIYDNFKYVHHIQAIHLDYTFNNSFMNYILKVSNEKQLIDILLLLPPQNICITQPLTLSAWKAIYTILYDSYNIKSVYMQYDTTSSLNVGVAYSFREKLYMNWKPNNALSRFVKYMVYHFLSLFVKKGLNQQYKFNDNIKKLNVYLAQEKCMFILFFVFIILYYMVTIFFPFYFSQLETDHDICKNNIPWAIHICYIVFAVVTACIEFVVFKLLTDNVGDYLPNLIDEEQFNSDDNQIQGVVQKVKQQIKKNKWITYSFQFISSQLARYDLYTDVTFIIVCFDCEYFVLGRLSVIMTTIFVGFHGIRTLQLVYKKIRQKERKMSTEFINDFYELVSHLELRAVGDVLDYISPFNVSVIPNNFITRLLMPSLCGKSVNNKVLNSTFSFFLEDTPQLLLGVIFVYYNQSKSVNYHVIIAIILSIINILIAFYNFMSIRQTSLSQIDFNYLIKEKMNQYPKQINNLIMIEQKQLGNWMQQYYENKQLSFEIIPNEYNENDIQINEKQNEFDQQAYHNLQSATNFPGQ